jgi:hypothetical protein
VLNSRRGSGSNKALPCASVACLRLRRGASSSLGMQLRASKPRRAKQGCSPCARAARSEDGSPYKLLAFFSSLLSRFARGSMPAVTSKSVTRAQEEEEKEAQLLLLLLLLFLLQVMEGQILHAAKPST